MQNLCGLLCLSAVACTADAIDAFLKYTVPDELDTVLREVANAISEAEFSLASASVEARGKIDSGKVSRPRVPKRFKAPFQLISSGLGFGSKGLFVQDVERKAMRMDIPGSFPLTPKLDPPLFVNRTTLSLGKMTYQLSGSSQRICRSFSGFSRAPGFHDMFSWASNPLLSEFLGSHSVAGRQCTLWKFRLGLGLVHQTLCADGNAPVELNISLAGHTKVSGYSMSFRFEKLEAQGSDVDPELLDKPGECETVAPACSNGRGEGPLALDAYVFHPGMSAIDYDLGDQNVADLTGDAVFICADRMQNNSASSFIDHNYTRISRYSLLVAPAYGQYAACNGYPDTSPPGPTCFGGDTRLVGREAPLFAGDGELRCASKSPIGFWYGLPKAGRCMKGRAPGLDAWKSGCTWSVLKRLKTIDQKCLLDDHSFVRQCFEDVQEGKGFPRSTAALAAAFSSEDASKGGCPDLGGPDRDELLVV